MIPVCKLGWEPLSSETMSLQSSTLGTERKKWDSCSSGVFSVSAVGGSLGPGRPTHSTAAITTLATF
jgi:hypothetical protein